MVSSAKKHLSKDRAPIFVVGLPRSGSTLVSYLLNTSSDILCVNDLYFVQTVLANNLHKKKLTSELTVYLMNKILQVIYERSLVNNDFIGQLKLTENELSKLRAELTSLAHFTPLISHDWSWVMNETLSRIAARQGKIRWADKTPQNFLHLELLQQRFPSAKFVFIFRDPRRILLSYKNVRDTGHEQYRYHPIIYSLYWREAVKKFQFSRANNYQVQMIRYEDLLSAPDKTINQVNSFLETDIPCPRLDSIGTNSSFRDNTFHPLTQTEKWICQVICKTGLNYMGYSLHKASPQLKDFQDLLLTTLRASCFHFKNFFIKDRRKRMSFLVKQIWKG